MTSTSGPSSFVESYPARPCNDESESRIGKLDSTWSRFRAPCDQIVCAAAQRSRIPAASNGRLDRACVTLLSKHKSSAKSLSILVFLISATSTRTVDPFLETISLGSRPKELSNDAAVDALSSDKVLVRTSRGFHASSRVTSVLNYAGL